MTTPHTNEPKMPEVIYAENNHTGHIWSINNESYRTSYTRTDKVKELKEALRECLEALQTAQSFGDWEKATAVFTKASNLLK